MDSIARLGAEAPHHVIFADIEPGGQIVDGDRLRRVLGEILHDGRDLFIGRKALHGLRLRVHGAAQQRPQPVPAVLQKVRQYLHEQYAQKITLDTLSARYNISKYHLQRSFQRYFGQSPGEYLTRLRLTRAKELLRATDLPVSEVAYRVGMENTSYFISVFRSREGATPQQYRRRWSPVA